MTDINRWCRIFGHTWKAGWYGSRPYLSATYRTVDNVGSEHIDLHCRCDRCGEEVLVAHIHKATVDLAAERAYEKHPHLRKMARAALKGDDNG